MDDQPNLREFLDEVSNFAEGSTATSSSSASDPAAAIGEVFEIAGSGSQIRMDAAVLGALQSHSDPSVAMSGQVGSQVKMVVGNNWLIANVRTMRASDSDIVAHVDFLGEGTRDFDRQGQQLPPRRHALPHPGQPRVRRQHRRSSLGLRSHR